MTHTQDNVPSWLEASERDMHAADLDSPLADLAIADHSPLADAYQHASRMETASPSQVRAYKFASALMSMVLVANERTSSFEPMVQNISGGRSAAPVDFEHHVDTLVALADRVRNPLVRARAADVAWSMNRKLHARATQAVLAYEETIEAIEEVRLRMRLGDRDEKALTPEAYGFLYRAIVVAKQSKRTAEVIERLLAKARALLQLALTRFDIHAALLYGGLCARFGAMESIELASVLESFASSLPPSASVHTVARLLQEAKNAYHRAKQPDAVSRLKIAESECLARAADRETNAWSRVALLQDAISALHGERRSPFREELQERLVREQRTVVEELPSRSIRLDLKESIAEALKRVRTERLPEALFAFAALYEPPSTERLVNEAIAAIREFPMSSLLSQSLLDSSGKVLHKTDGGLEDLTATSPTVLARIAYGERARVVPVAQTLDQARREISLNFEISDIALARLLLRSPFVPREHLESLSIGLAHFFRGDIISAAYILLPQFETILRHVVQLLGKVTSTFDDADETQRERMLGWLLDLPVLRDALPHELLDDLKRQLIETPGMNLRNQLAHGLLKDASVRSFEVVYVCWLMLHLCLLPLHSDRAAICRELVDAAPSTRF